VPKVTSLVEGIGLRAVASCGKRAI